MESFSEPRATTVSKPAAKSGPATQASLERGGSQELDPCQDSQVPMNVSKV